MVKTIIFIYSIKMAVWPIDKSMVQLLFLLSLSLFRILFIMIYAIRPIFKLPIEKTWKDVKQKIYPPFKGGSESSFNLKQNKAII